MIVILLIIYSVQHSLLNNGMDINVLPVWTSNITGRGVTVAVIDDGMLCDGYLITIDNL